jgi:hypothetical protein
MQRTGQDVREWLKGKLRRDIPDPIWNVLRQDGYVNEALIDEDGWQERLTNRVRLLLQAVNAPKRKPSGRPKGSLNHPTLAEEEQERTVTLARCYARHASTRRDVRGFRQNVLGETCSPRSKQEPFWPRRRSSFCPSHIAQTWVFLWLDIGASV